MLNIKNISTLFFAITASLISATSIIANCGCNDTHTSKLPQCATPQQTPETSSNHWGIQGSIVDGGATAIGLVNYGEHHSAGVTISGFLKTTGKTTHVFTPGFFAGPRFKIRENTYFAVGIDVSSRLGKDNGKSINCSVNVGPYLSIEYHPLRHIVLTAWINPYTYQNEKIAGKRTTTHKFAAGGIGISYLFSCKTNP